MSSIPWVNQNDVTGINVPPYDSKATAQAIMDICTDQQRYQRDCRQSRQRYEQLFRMEDMITACQQLYEEIVAS